MNWLIKFATGLVAGWYLGAALDKVREWKNRKEQDDAQAL